MGPKPNSTAPGVLSDAVGETWGRIMGNPTIWVVDDDPSVQRAMWRLIESMSCTCVVFSNGHDMLNRLSTSRPDLLILDVHMPGLSGRDVLAELRARDISLPVVMITGVERDDLREACRASGAFDVLGKPVGAAEVGAVLARIGHHG